MVSRRAFMRAMATAGASVWAEPAVAAGAQSLRELRAPESARGRFDFLSDRFTDLARHFIFEYYPWYASSPWQHWTQANRNPPVDIASNYMPRLGAYDSRDARVLEQHARWIADTGVGAINVSWWGRDRFEDRGVSQLMDVMAAHDIRVTFHLEPYSARHALDYARDIQYLITEYGDRRRWDAFLLLQHADGRVGPVFKSFRTILPPTSVDCHGVQAAVPDYAPDDVWRIQTDRVRELFRSDFDRITLLADSLSVNRARSGGFDGIAIYDDFVEPDTWRGHARACTAADLVFSFNINAGFDGIVERVVPPDSCYRPPAFEPPASGLDWSQPADRERAAAISTSRISRSFHTTLALQIDPSLTNVKHGFFLTYINTFNEWHEGTQFEPMKDAAALTPEERAVGYHNPADGGYRLKRLKQLLGTLVS